MTTLADTGTLVFDGDCGFCTRVLGWLRLLDRGSRITSLPLQRDGVPESIGSTPETCRSTLHWHADGHSATGAEAAATALAVATRSRLPVLLYRRTAPLQERAYTWVAANRGRFPGTTPWCERHPQACSRTP
jgi:predicted DCC family thiol-disulfide oxidoreductase YuxK